MANPNQPQSSRPQDAAPAAPPTAEKSGPTLEELQAQLAALAKENAALKASVPAAPAVDENAIPGSTVRPEGGGIKHFTHGTPIFNVARPTGRNG